MADTSRFPPLVYPFAITGAAAGWLSAGLAGHTVSQGLAALCATVITALAGAILKRLCVGKRYTYELEPPDPELRPRTDRWLLHAAIVVAAGAATGGVMGLLNPYCCTRTLCAFEGGGFAVVFVPVCLAVVAAARRAQRARLGSLVAECDRRAVWGILAITLGVTTLEAAPDWPLEMAGYHLMPQVAVTMLALAGALTLAIRVADARALARARGEIEAGLAARGTADPEPDDAGVAQLDWGSARSCWRASRAARRRTATARGPWRWCAGAPSRR